MASSTPTAPVPEEDYSCPVCRDVFKDPVLLSCSHSFCNVCVQECWRTKNTEECPLCKEVHITTGHPPPRNLALRNLCEAFEQERGRQRAAKCKRTSPAGPEDLCGLHAEKHKLFCLECQQPVCVVCVHSEKHASHSFKPIDEAALEHKNAAQKSLKTLREKMKVFNEVKRKSDQTASHFKAKVRHTEWHIKEQFEKLHQFLRGEWKASIAALREEERQKSQMMKERIEGLNRDILTLSNHITATEEELRAEHVSFLQNYKTTMERAQFTLQDPQPVSALIDVAKHLGNLAFRVWDKMKDMVSYAPVTLDPSTAQPLYTLSDDLTSARWGEWQLPDSRFPFNFIKFDHFPFVLGSEGFDSGAHSWDVEVRDSASWLLGAAQRRGDRQGNHWGISLFKGNYVARFFRAQPGSAKCTVLSVKKQPHRIRVQLDWNERTLSFSDPDTDTHIHTFEDKRTFTEALFPFIATGHVPLKMLPGKISVTVEQCS